MSDKYSDFKTILKKPWLYYSYLLVKSLLGKKISSKFYVVHKYRYKTGEKLNLQNPNLLMRKSNG